jgi:hypothetical protein
LYQCGIEVSAREFCAVGIKSVWIIASPLESVYIRYPTLPTEIFGTATVPNAATHIEIRLEKLFK